MNKLSPDTVFQSGLTGLMSAALNHNALVIQLSAEVIAAGPGQKTEHLKRIRAKFNELHKDYSTEYKRVTDELQKAIEEGTI